MAEKVTLDSFPFDNQEVLNAESGQMESDREYDAERYRKYFAKFLSNGIYYGHYNNYGENGMKVTSDGGLNIRIAKGAGIIEGADFESKEDQVFTLERPTTGERIDRVVIRLDKSLAVRETQVYIKQGNGIIPASLQRDDNIYEICIAEVTVKSTTNIINSDVVDTRLDKTICGIVNSLISIDGKELYQKFQDYIDTVTDNLVRKDQESIVLVGTITDSNGGTSEKNFTDDEKKKLASISENANKIIVNNTLTSTSTEEALSANMGKKLHDEKQNKITYGTSIPSRRK